MTTQQFINFVQTKRNAMLLTAHKYLSEAEDAEDTVQEVLMKLWSARERIGNPEEFSKYADTAVRNTALNALREKQKHEIVPIDQQQLAMHTHGPDTQMEVLERQTQIDNIIAQLSATDRTLLKMRNIDQLSYSQISQMLGINEGAVRQRISRIRINIVNRIKDI